VIKKTTPVTGVKKKLIKKSLDELKLEFFDLLAIRMDKAM